MIFDRQVYCCLVYIILMRSKRKEVNKLGIRAGQGHTKEHENSVHRSTGIKPFQLVKLRQGQRSSLDLAHTHNGILHRRTGSNNLYGQEKEIYIDLIIKQKLIIDAQANQKLESERKSIISLEKKDLEWLQKMGKKGDEELIYSQAYQTQCFQPSHQMQQIINDQTVIQQPKRKRNKCQCCLQFKTATHAIIRHKHQDNLLEQAESEQRDTSGQEKAAVTEAMKELKGMKQRALPPFSFTSSKWRSKSQILQVDKWKEKYGRDIHLAQKLQIFQKTISSKLQHHKGSDSPTYQSAEHHKTSLPILHKSKELESKARIFRHSTSKKQLEVFRMYNPEGESQHAYILLTENQKEGNAKRQKQETQQKIEIAIKKMYDSDEKTYEQPQPYIIKPVEQAVLPEKEKPKRKKPKFPEIKISTFYSTKEEAHERKRMRIENIQRLTREWRYNPPKKVHLQKIMEEVPERWQYGESRESSREVGHYLQYQQQGAMKMQLIEENMSQIKNQEGAAQTLRND